MKLSQKHKLALVTVTYWFLLAYIVAALLWWFIALNNQNKSMAAMRTAELNKDDIAYAEKLQQINSMQSRKTAQYLGEGISFLAVIMLGAVFIYRATRKQIKFAQQQQNFMMAVTHELKTPIAVAQLNLETIQKRPLDIEKQKQLIDNSLQEVNRLNSLCNNILWAAQLDAGSYTNKKEEINVSDVVTGCVEDCNKRLNNSQVQADIADGIYLDSDILLMQILINNLLDNAIKYSEKNTPISISLSQQNNTVYLQVKDEGTGVADTEKKAVFEKFYRSGSEAVRRTKGTGLGLYLCKKIVQHHHGNISVANNPPKGSIFTVTIPV